jgi:hypothetical protein
MTAIQRKAAAAGRSKTFMVFPAEGPGGDRTVVFYPRRSKLSRKVPFFNGIGPSGHVKCLFLTRLEHRRQVDQVAQQSSIDPWTGLFFNLKNSDKQQEGGLVMGWAAKVLTTVVIAAVLSGCAPGQQSLKIQEIPAQVGGPGTISIIERDNAARCVMVTPGRVVNYSFDSDRQVPYTVAMSKEGEDFISVSRSNTAFSRGTLIPQGDLKYCFLWKSHTRQPVRINYEINIAEGY